MHTNKPIMAGLPTLLERIMATGLVDSLDRRMGAFGPKDEEEAGKGQQKLPFPTLIRAKTRRADIG